MLVRKNLSEVQSYETVHRPRNARFASFFVQSLPKSSKTLPKHHLGPNGGYWVCSCEKIYREFETPKQYVRVPKNTHFASKRTKTLPIIILGLTLVIGSVRAKKFVGSSVCQNCAFGPQMLFSHHFSCSRYPNPPNHSQNII